MRSGGGVLCVSVLQFLVGLALLIIYEAYKTHYFKSSPAKTTEASVTARALTYKTPLDWLFWLAIVNNIFSVFGLAGVLHSFRELVSAFFVFNAIQVIVAFAFFLDVCVDVGLRFAGEPLGTQAYENAAAAFLFFNFMLSMLATYFAIRAVDEIRQKQKDEYNRLNVLSDTLHFEPDQ